MENKWKTLENKWKLLFLDLGSIAVSLQMNLLVSSHLAGKIRLRGN